MDLSGTTVNPDRVTARRVVMNFEKIGWKSGLTVAVLLTFSGCDASTINDIVDGIDIPGVSSDADPETYVGPSSVECNENDGDFFAVGQESESISVSVDESTVTIRDLNAELNCCLEGWMEATVDGNTITAVEIEDHSAGEGCFCTCGRELFVQVPELEDGTYEVVLYRFDTSEENLLTVLDVTVAASASPIVTSFEVGACGETDGATDMRQAYDESIEDEAIEIGFETNTDDETQPSIYLRTGGSGVVVIHEAAPINCCAEFDVEVAIDGSTISVTEFEVASPDGLCRCMCNSTVETTIDGLGAGDYEIHHISVSAAGATSFVTVLPVHCAETTSDGVVCTE
jgi:hypothetical protein